MQSGLLEVGEVGDRVLPGVKDQARAKLAHFTFLRIGA
jgi:hypothetical protein